MKHCFLLCLLLLSGSVRAQTPAPLARWPLAVAGAQPVRVAFDQPYTSAFLQIPTNQPLTGAHLVAGADTLPLHRDAHTPGGYVSVLCVFREPVRFVTLLPGTLRGDVELISLYAPPLPAADLARLRQLARQGGAACDKPAVVPASVWRRGLMPPKEPPTANRVQFIIVHHSAGSNAVTNYTEEVRNIYLQHTTVNGWNDVGYNFLLGRDGVIYEGRDGQGVLDGDNVLGAHFCSTNTGTMGICMLGNYNDAQPSDSALAAIDRLIGWKLRKEGLEPVGMAFHTGSGKQLNRVSGHRDGVCATECPGDNLYAKLTTMRQDVGKLCSFTSVVGVALATEPTAGWTIYPNPARGVLFVQYPASQPARVRFDLFDALGRSWPLLVTATTTDRWRLSARQTPPGLYWLRCTDGPTSTVRPVWWQGE